MLPTISYSKFTSFLILRLLLELGLAHTPPATRHLLPCTDAPTRLPPPSGSTPGCRPPLRLITLGTESAHFHEGHCLLKAGAAQNRGKSLPTGTWECGFLLMVCSLKTGCPTPVSILITFSAKIDHSASKTIHSKVMFSGIPWWSSG